MIEKVVRAVTSGKGMNERGCPSSSSSMFLSVGSSSSSSHTIDSSLYAQTHTEHLYVPVYWDSVSDYVSYMMGVVK